MTDTPKAAETETRKPVDPRKFYVVWSPQGGPPMVRLASFESARAIATKLSGKHPGQDFFVLASCWSRMARPAVEAEPPRPEPGDA